MYFQQDVERISKNSEFQDDYVDLEGSATRIKDRTFSKIWLDVVECFKVVEGRVLDQNARDTISGLMLIPSCQRLQQTANLSLN